MLSHLPRLVPDLRTSLFGTALLGLVLGFGVFFDHLADVQDAQGHGGLQRAEAATPSLVRLAWRSTDDVQQLKVPLAAPVLDAAQPEPFAAPWRKRAATDHVPAGGSL